MAQTKNKRTIILFSIATALLIIPLVATFISDEVIWSAFDFVVAAVLLYGTVGIIELASRKIQNNKKKLALIVVVLFALLLVWVELAVGLFGSPIAGS